MYFVMPDRFANGDTGNDTGGISGDRLDNGFDPTDKGFYHGGDLAGLLDELDYLEDMGVTAIWMTPMFKNNPVQGSGANVSAGYHGYWITDFTQFDPHFGTNAELEALIDEAHSRGHQGLLRHHHQPHGRHHPVRGRRVQLSQQGRLPLPGCRRQLSSTTATT